MEKTFDVQDLTCVRVEYTAGAEDLSFRSLRSDELLDYDEFIEQLTDCGLSPEDISTIEETLVEIGDRHIKAMAEEMTTRLHEMLMKPGAEETARTERREWFQRLVQALAYPNLPIRVRVGGEERKVAEVWVRSMGDIVLTPEGETLQPTADDLDN